MQVVDGWVQGGDVTAPTATVLVDGVAADVESWSVSRELGGGLPDQVVAASGLVAAEGQVAWAAPESVSTYPGTPWTRRAGFPPASGAGVVVRAGMGGVEADQLTGIVDETTGSLTDGSAQSSLIDHIDKLNRPVTIGPLLDAMPPLTEGGDVRYTGLLTSYVTDRVLRLCGFYATPPTTPGTVLSVPMMGSAWPEVGTCTAAVSMTAGEAFPRWETTEWGAAAISLTAEYTPATARPLNAALEVTMMMPPTGAGNPSVWVDFGTVGVRLATTSGSVVAQTFAPTLVNAVSTTRGEATLVVMRVTPSGSDLLFELRTNRGGLASATVAAPAGITTTNMSRVRVIAGDGGKVGAVKVSFPTTTFADLTFAPTAIFRLASPFPNRLVCVPALVKERALDILTDQARSECAAMWIDEQGRFRWTDRTVLGVGAPSRTLTARDDLLDLTWEDASAGARAKVMVDWRQPAVSRSRWPNVTLWQGRGGTMESAQVMEDFLHPGADEEWIMVDTNQIKVGGEANMPRVNAGRGTIVGGVRTESGATVSYAGEYLTVSVIPIDARTVKIAHTTSTLPAGQQMALETPDLDFSTTLWRRWRDKALPIVRGFARVEWADATTAAAQTGPAWASDLVHDAGWWVQTEDRAQHLADSIAAYTSNPIPVVRDLEVVPDARVQLGDVVDIVDPDRVGVSLRGVVFGKTISGAAGEQSMRLSVRVLRILGASSTMGAHDALMAGLSMGGHDSSHSGQTVAQHNANPIHAI